MMKLKLKLRKLNRKIGEQRKIILCIKTDTYNTRCFTKNNFNNRISLDEADEYQVELLIKIIDFKNNTKPKSPERKKETLQSIYSLFDCTEMFYKGFKNGIFPIKKLKIQVSQLMMFLTVHISKYLLLNKCFKDCQ